MIAIRTCTPEDAAAVSVLLGELGYTISLPQATENLRELCKTGSDPIFLAAADAQVVGLLAEAVEAADGVALPATPEGTALDDAADPSV